MTTSRISDESLNQLIAIESLACDNASYDNRRVDQIYHSDIVSALEELRGRRKSSVNTGTGINNEMLVPAKGPKVPPMANKDFTKGWDACRAAIKKGGAV